MREVADEDFDETQLIILDYLFGTGTTEDPFFVCFSTKRLLKNYFELMGLKL